MCSNSVHPYASCIGQNAEWLKREELLTESFASDGLVVLMRAIVIRRQPRNEESEIIMYALCADFPLETHWNVSICYCMSMHGF